MAKVLDCDFVLGEFVFHWIYFVHFRLDIFQKAMKSLSFPAMGWIVPLLFYKDGFSIKCPTKINTSFNKETKPNLVDI